MCRGEKKQGKLHNTLPVRGGAMHTESWSVSGVEEQEHPTGAAKTEGGAGQEGGLSESLREFAERVREMAAQAGSEADRGMRDFGEVIAGKVERMAALVDSKDAEALRAGLKNLARENPLLVSAGAFAAGILLSRILKHSFPHERRSGDAE
jgi:hypothetical protein